MVERIKAYAHDTPESIVHLINYKDTTFVLFCDEISRGSASKSPLHQQVVFLLSSGGESAILAKKKRLPIVFFRIYVCSLKDQAGKSKYPRT